MLLKHIKKYIFILCTPILPTPYIQASEQDTLNLNIEQLFERASSYHLHLAADRIKEQIADKQAQTARNSRLPEINIGLRGGYLGQPIVWQNGLSHATHPESPD